MKFIIEARVYLLRTDEGGRLGFISNKYRPNFLFDENNPWVNTDGEMLFEDTSGKYEPGSEFTTTIRFYSIDRIKDFLKTGNSFFIQEGSKKVGKGQILVVRGFISSEI